MRGQRAPPNDNGDGEIDENFWAKLLPIRQPIVIMMTPTKVSHTLCDRRYYSKFVSQKLSAEVHTFQHTVLP